MEADMRISRALAAMALATAWAGTPGVSVAAADEGAAPPARLQVSGSLRLRHETLSAPFRAGRTGSDQLASWRLRLLAEYDAGPFVLGAELLDARGVLNDSGSVLTPNLINTLEPYQLYARVRTGSRSSLQLGRFNMAVGSGRLIAHNDPNNSPFNFDGARWRHAISDDWALEAFFVAPVRIEPRDAEGLLGNRTRLDANDWDTRLWGVHLTRSGLAGAWRGEAYAIGLDQDGGPELISWGARLMRPPAPGKLDADMEAVLQTGEQPAAAGARDIRAGLIHMGVGYTFDDAWRTRLSAQLVHAGGDQGGAGDAFNRFNPLFGGRFMDFGPALLFGPLARENLTAIGARYQARQGPLQLNARVQEARLAVASDRWRMAGLRDASGQSGRRIGTILDASVGYDFAAHNVRIEAGAAMLIKGRFAREAPGAPAGGDPVYTYVMLTRSF
jgi:hypothetical protein